VPVLLYSGGIDSFALFKALNPEEVAHFVVDPKVTKLAMYALYLENPRVRVHLFDHRPFLKRLWRRLSELSMTRLVCEGCKRGMIEKVSKISDEIIIGDSLGQVASQTLANMMFITNGRKVLRPLAGSDKEDVEEFLADKGANIARKVSKAECPWKPKKVSTGIKEWEAKMLEAVVLEELSNIKYLGMRTAQELISKG